MSEVKTKSYRGYKVTYSFNGAIYEGTAEGLCDLKTMNETQLISLFHKAVMDKREGKPVSSLIVSEGVEEAMAAKQKNDKKADIPATNVIVGDVLAPKLADIFLVEECKIVYAHSGNKYKIASINEDGIAECQTVEKEELAENYKIISRMPMKFFMDTLDAQTKSRENFLGIRMRIEKDIDQLDKSDDQIADELIEFIKNNGDLTDLQKQQYLELL